MSDQLPVSQSFETFHFGYDRVALRTITDQNGEPWFVLADVCSALGLDNPSKVKKRLQPDDAATLDSSTLRSMQGGSSPHPNMEVRLNIINESGLYSCVFQSRRPEAQDFQRWITKEVIPALRKAGITPGQELTPGELLVLQAQRFLEMEREQRAQAQTLDRHSGQIGELQTRVDQLAPGTGYMTITGFFKTKGLQAPIQLAQWFGKVARQLCLERTIPISKVADERFGSVNSYPIDILEEVLNTYNSYHLTHQT